MADTGSDMEIVNISDTDDGGSAEEVIKTSHSIAGHAKKRKIEDEIFEKVQLTDDSDGPIKKPKRKRGKRKSTSGKGRKSAAKGEGVPDVDADLLEDLPDYLRERRRAFDEERKKHHENALMIPPDYEGIALLHTTGHGHLAVRPKFEESSGVKPSRPLEDIDLPQSAGTIPASIAHYLRDYQVEGVRFLHQKFVYQEGGILGDDMGLGKTVQVAAFLAAAFGKTGDERDDKRMREMRFHSDRWYPRILIVCPGSLIMNWRNELERWGWWHIDTYHGPRKDDVLASARAGMLEVMITTYETYKNCKSAINMVVWDAVIADECHRLKDRSAESTKAMKEINALCRIGLTGTAIQNKYEELWTLLDWANPGHFGSLAEWSQAITKPLTVGQSHDATEAQLGLARQVARKLVQNLLPRYFMRRMKSLIADQLPKKTDRVAFCPLTDLQLDAYKNFLDSADMQVIRSATETCNHGQKRGWCCGKYLPDGAHWQSAVFPGMVTLQKLANHLTLLTPNTTDLDEKHKNDLRRLKACLPKTWKKLYDHRDQIRYLVHPEYCGKWKVLKRLLQYWERSGDKVLVFSHSVRLLRILQHLFSMTHYSISYLDGSLSYEQRQEVVDTFNSDPTQFVFLISTKAGGVGLNITAANKVVIMDPHWNPSYDLQAQDRAYRIGQTRDVEVFRLISVGTVEEIVYARQIYKQQQANIGYMASSERRYFKGVQQDTERKGEIFGLSNIFTYHSESGLLRDIVNKTNIAEAKAGVSLVDVNMEEAAKDGAGFAAIKEEPKGDDDGDAGMSQLAALITSQDPDKEVKEKAERAGGDIIQAILSAAGVEYTHDNSEVVGSSKVEEQLSRKAARLSTSGTGDVAGQAVLFADSDEEDDEGLEYNPPPEVQLRQFCEMAKEFGFANPTEFALVVEGWTQEKRRNCLETFYKRRASLLAEQTPEGDHEDGADIKLKDEDEKGEVLGPKAEDFLKKEEGGLKDEEAEKKSDKIESSPGVKLEVKPDVKDDVKVELKSEANDLKNEGDVRLKTEDNIKPKIEDKIIKMEGSSKRTSIFLSDDDDDDEL
ncbi:type III restriction enzyme, res subunit domain-containing protein [Sarocladium implicatum]|nr:type III restriction enzyme, res subunit domain-containing protein [Sarocladium implicatum]